MSGLIHDINSIDLNASFLYFRDLLIWYQEVRVWVPDNGIVNVEEIFYGK